MQNDDGDEEGEGERRVCLFVSSSEHCGMPACFEEKDVSQGRGVIFFVVV